MKHISALTEAWNVIYVARWEIFTFCSAMLLYALVFAKRRIFSAQSLHNKSKLIDYSVDDNAHSARQRPAKDSCTARHRLAKDSCTESPQPDVARHVVMIRKCGFEGNLKGAVKIFESLKESGVEMNSIIYNTVLDAAVKCKDLKAANDWMKTMQQAGMVDVVSYNTMIKAYLMNNSLDKAREIVYEMKSAGVQPSSVTFNELINAFVSYGGAKNDIWDMVKEMKEMGTPPNQVTCSILLKNLNSHSGKTDIENVMDLIGSLNEPMDEVLMSSMVEACVRIGKPDLLTSKLQELQDARKLAVNSCHTFGSLIKAYGHARDLRAVWRCWREMRSRHIKPTAITVGCMIEALVQNANTEAAYDLIHDLQADEQLRSTLNAVVYCSILKGFSREKKPDRVWEAYRDMEQNKFEMTLITFNTVLDSCARTGRMNDVSKILDDMKKHCVEPNLITYSTILKGHCQAGSIKLGFEILLQMKRETSLMPDEIMYNSLLDGCAQNGLYSEGMDVYHEMLREGVEPSLYTLSILVKLMNRSRRVEEAFNIVKEVSDKYGLKPNVHVYTNLIQACVSNRRHARALTAVEAMVKDKVAPDSRTYGVLIRSSIYQNQCQQAEGFLRAALGLPGAHALLADPQFAIGTKIDSDMVNDVLHKMRDCGCMNTIVVPLLADLKNSMCKVYIDPMLQHNLQGDTSIPGSAVRQSFKGKSR